ncbi:hypothetical protein GBA52_018140 [Prunus armeniaca]|nr:hypothetical protein GBA52_018140 [Prunus armeniaca]
MERDCLRHTHTKDTHNPNTRDRTGGDASASLLLRASSDAIRHATTPSDFVLQWGNRKRLRCMKIQVKDKGKDDSDAPVTRTTVRVDRRVVRPDKDPANQPSTAGNSNQTNGYLNLRQRPLSPQQPPLQRVLRNSETTTSAMRGQSNGGLRGELFHPTTERVRTIRKATTTTTTTIMRITTPSLQPLRTRRTIARRGGGSSSGSGDAALVPPMVWPPKFVIALTNKEKEEDFMAIKGSKLPQRPKKRAKFIQRTLNLVSPGAWLCDLTLERYEVREKKISFQEAKQTPCSKQHKHQTQEEEEEEEEEEDEGNKINELFTHNNDNNRNPQIQNP